MAKLIDLEPGDYRRRDPHSGRWLQNVNRKACRIGALVGLATIGLFFAAAVSGGYSAMWPMFLFLAGMSFMTGAAFTLSLRSIDW